MDAKNVLDIFKEITRIPRESGHEGPMTAFLQDFAKARGLECRTDKTGNVVAIKNVTENDDLMIINRSGLTIRMAVSGISVLSRATQGVRLISLRDGDAISAVSVVSKSEEEEELEAVGTESAETTTDNE